MFDEYITKYSKRLFGLCLKLCSSIEDSEDLYQETWIKAYKAYHMYDCSKEFEGWLTAICVNTYRDMLRKQKWKRLFKVFLTNEEKDFALSNVFKDEDEKDYCEVKQAVNELPEKYRLVVTLYYFNDLDIKKTSQALNIPEGTIKYHLHRARELLKRRLNEYE